MHNALTPIPGRTRPWVLLARCGLLVVLGFATACPECDPDLCEEDCDETYPMSEAERGACYLDCAEAAQSCRDNRR